MNTYYVIEPQDRGSFAEQMAEVCQRIRAVKTEAVRQGHHLQYAKVVLSDAQNQYAGFMASELYHGVLDGLALSVVQQPPLCGAKLCVLLKETDEEDNFLFHSMRLYADECKGLTSYVQTLLLFEKYLKTIKKLGLTLKDNCVRTWLYVADIDVNYDGVVKARNDIFKSHGLTVDTHFIASTGIGGYSQTRNASVAIDFLTYPDMKEADMKYLHALDHLNPTHEYGVSFERGTRVSTPSGSTCFISGTASIDSHGQIVNKGDVLAQADRLLENIDSLLHDGGAGLADVEYFMVYLRDAGDYSRVRAYMAQRFPAIPHLIVNAKVCRPEWLIEMECIARKR